MYQLAWTSVLDASSSARVLTMSRTAALIATIILVGCAAQRQQTDYVTVSRQLDIARAQITPPLGATVYELDRQRLASQPGGDNRSLAQSLAQLPGVAVLPGGQITVRGQ
jgi:hypothetical protein